jgi:uncharacterized protein YkwD
MMKQKFSPEVYFLFILAIVILTGSQSFGQFSKTKPAPKPTPRATPKPTASPAKTVSTAASGQSGDTLNALETKILAEINELRTDPSAYVKYLEQMKSNFNGNTLKLSDGMQLVTNEGAAAVNDAITFLKAARPLSVFRLSPGLTKAARDHLQDLIKKDMAGHKGSDGSLPPQRVERYGQWSVTVKENISYLAQTPRDIVINMLLDDGNPKREHRKNLLSKDLKVVGLAVGDGKTYGRLCVIVFAGEFTEKRAGK